MADPQSVTVWLAVIAIATSIQALLFLGAAIFAWRAASKASAAIDDIKREMLAPTIARANRTLESVDEVMGRVRAAEDSVRHKAAETAERARRVTATIKYKGWPVVAAVRAVAAAVRGFKEAPGGSRRLALARIPSSRVARGEDDESRFVYEGGTHARN